jgi:branched-chain amino acid transport system permease protein
MDRRKERIDRGVKARSADIFALTSYREMLYLLIPGSVPVVGLLCFTPLLSDYWREVMISTAIYALLAMSWDMLMSAGLLSL